MEEQEQEQEPEQGKQQEQEPDDSKSRSRRKRYSRGTNNENTFRVFVGGVGPFHVRRKGLDISNPPLTIRH